MSPNPEEVANRISNISESIIEAAIQPLQSSINATYLEFSLSADVKFVSQQMLITLGEDKGIHRPDGWRLAPFSICLPENAWNTESLISLQNTMA